MAKIGYLATHGVGKTGLCHYTVFYFKQLGIKAEFIPEVAREAVRLGLPINEKTTLEAQEAILNLQMAWELAYDARSAAGEFSHFASDRTIFCNYAYPRLRFGKEATSKMYDSLMYYNDKHPYDLLLKIPLWNGDENITADGVRSVDKQFQMDIDGTIDDIMRETGVVYNVIPDKIFRMWRVAQTMNLTKYFDQHFKILK